MPFNLENFESCEIPADEVFLITEETLDTIYASSSEVDQFYPFFHLQNEYFILKNQNLARETAYVCCLISYYVFTALTPPHSEEIALEYAQEAVRRDPCAKYIQWLDIVKQGN